MGAPQPGKNDTFGESGQEVNRRALASKERNRGQIGARGEMALLLSFLEREER